MKYFFTFIFILTNQLSFAQDNCPKYNTYIAKGDSCFYKLKDETKYNLAINAYSAAMLHCPQKAAEARLRIKAVFDTIQNLRLEADKNFREAKNATKRAEDSAKVAKREREKADSLKTIAVDALKISDANNLLYEAQGMVKYDPTLALHLAATAIENIKTIDNLNKNDSLIFDKANRIYYENNFYNTIIAKPKKDSTGSIINAVFLKKSNNICAITDSAYAIEYDQKGDIIKVIELEKGLKYYRFIFCGEGNILVHGCKSITDLAYGKIWDIENGPIPVLVDTIDQIFPEKDSLLFNPYRDTTAGWAKRLFVFGYKAFQLNSNNKLVPLFSKVSKNICLVTFSPDGNFIATNDGSKSIKFLDRKGKPLDTILNTEGGVAETMEFSPDNKKLLVTLNNSNALLIYKLIENNGVWAIENSPSTRIDAKATAKTPLTLQDYKMSKTGERILISAIDKQNRNQQVIQLWQKNLDTGFVLYASFICAGAENTSAVFSKDETEILSSSSTIKLWKIPEKSTKPKEMNNMSEVITSVEYDTAAALIHAFTFSNRRQNYFLDGNFFNYSDTVHSEEISTRLAAFLPNKKTLMVSEDGLLRMYDEKVSFESYIKNFKFDEFTDVQKKRFKIIK